MVTSKIALAASLSCFGLAASLAYGYWPPATYSASLAGDANELKIWRTGDYDVSIDYAQGVELGPNLTLRLLESERVLFDGAREAPVHCTPIAQPHESCVFGPARLPAGTIVIDVSEPGTIGTLTLRDRAWHLARATYHTLAALLITASFALGWYGARAAGGAPR